MKSDAPARVALLLEVSSDADIARATRRQVQPLRGVRGNTQGAIARVADELQRTDPASLPADEDVLDRMFQTSWEDGLVAIALAAATIPDSPAAAAELAARWLESVDDLTTADAIGWMILGPAAIAGGTGAAGLVARWKDERPLARRAAAIAGLAWTPTPLEGAGAAAVRARLGQPAVQWVAELDEASVQAVLDGFAKDKDPHVQKAVRRLMRRWAEEDLEACGEWADAFRGGLPRLLRDELLAAREADEKAARRAARRGEA